MALDTSAVAQDWRLLVEIELTGLTLKVAEEPIAMDDGSFYEGDLRDLNSIFQSAGQILAPKVQTSRFNFSLDNSEATYTTHFADYTWRNRTVTIKGGQGNVIADYEDVYVGRVLVSGGVRFDENLMRINLTDPRNEDAKTLPANKFLPSAYPNMEEKSKYVPIPVVYGDFGSGATTGGERIPAFQIDSTVGTGGQFKWADHAVKDLELVWKRSSGGAWSSVAFSSESNSDATFTLDVSYDPDLDEIAVNGKGATDDGTETGTLLQTLPDIVDDILQTHLSVASGSIDATAFSDWESSLHVSEYGRRWIGKEISSNTLITEALVEGFADMTIQGGKYCPVYRIVPLTSLDTMRESDIISNRDGTKMIATASDPEETYLNEVAADYDFAPVSDRYAVRYEKADSAEQSDAGLNVRRRMKHNWLYLQVGAETRGERELFFMSQETEIVTLTLGPRAITKLPTDLFRLVYAQYVEDAAGLGVPFQIRQIESNYKAMRATVVAWNFAAFAFGRWTDDLATTWLLSTEIERDEQGYWTDADGYADTSVTPDEDSKDSIWI